MSSVELNSTFLWRRAGITWAYKNCQSAYTNWDGWLNPINIRNLKSIRFIILLTVLLSNRNVFEEVTSSSPSRRMRSGNSQYWQYSVPTLLGHLRLPRILHFSPHDWIELSHAGSSNSINNQSIISSISVAYVLYDKEGEIIIQLLAVHLYHSAVLLDLGKVGMPPLFWRILRFLLTRVSSCLIDKTSTKETIL